MKNRSKPKHKQFQAELRKAAQRWLTLPGLVLSYQAQTNPLGTEKWL